MSLLSSPSGTVAKPQPPKRHCTSTTHDDGYGDGDGDSEQSRTGNSGLFVACPVCHSEGQVISRRRRTKKQKRAYQNAKNNGLPLPPPPPIQMEPCKECSGSGIRPIGSVKIDQLPRVADDVQIGIIGGGIGGLALALACQHRNIPYTVYERDSCFDERSQGYGLTMQQGGKALQALGLAVTGDERLCGKGIHSKRHIVHKPDGTQVGEWGMKVWGREKKEEAKRQNAHIARQELRRIIYNQIEERDNENCIAWGHKLLEYTKGDDGGVKMTFLKSNVPAVKQVVKEATMLVGADGIRSAVRQNKIGEHVSPFRYLGCIVILGIAPSPSTSSLTNDNETVFQTADGTTRLYAMPFARKGQETANALQYLKNGSENSNIGQGETMWQLSFPLTENDAKKLSAEGAASLKQEALQRCGNWHSPIPELLGSTPEELVSGYPVYDRGILDDDVFRRGCVKEGVYNGSEVTLIGDAAHPMSPFKGQGANQALLDAVLLARSLYQVYRVRGDNENIKRDPEKLLEDILEEFESSMLKRSKGKVKASAEAAKFLHTEAAIAEGNVTRGAAVAALKDK
eukprot:CAMPEP_0194124428 /NCGR_PEP_ID=MMETSP0150-20130528/58519_1 /TAXON_ID=122233 /ORGANISM="Chaetoceros debilis, Strain MM31A-1" /LENGTH=569 /DNA_ID=CAMNT_0038818145 /DNA_START=208 /DNA_END=1917 /DNA_ORIENTATION=-